MKHTCPECKNDNTVETLAQDQVVECEMCGITLMAKDLSNPEDVQMEIVEEGK